MLKNELKHVLFYIKSKSLNNAQILLFLSTPAHVVTKRTRIVCEGDYYPYVHEKMKICFGCPII